MLSPLNILPYSYSVWEIPSWSNFWVCRIYFQMIFPGWLCWPVGINKDPIVCVDEASLPLKHVFKNNTSSTNSKIYEINRSGLVSSFAYTLKPLSLNSMFPYKHRKANRRMMFYTISVNLSDILSCINKAYFDHLAIKITFVVPFNLKLFK